MSLRCRLGFHKYEGIEEHHGGFKVYRGPTVYLHCARCGRYEKYRSAIGWDGEHRWYEPTSREEFEAVKLKAEEERKRMRA